MSDYRTPKRRRTSYSRNENTFAEKYNANAVTVRRSKRSFRGPVHKVSTFTRKVQKALNGPADWTKPKKIREFGPVQFSTAVEKVSYGQICRGSDYPSASNLLGKARANWTVYQVDPADSLTKSYTLDPYDTAGSDVKFKHGNKWTLKLKNNLTSGAEISFYLVKAKCQSAPTQNFLNELEQAYEAKYSLAAYGQIENDAWVSPTSGIFPKNFPRRHQIVWTSSVSMETGQECMINVPYYEHIYDHEAWGQLADGVSTSQLAKSYVLYYRLEGKIASSDDLETTQFVNAPGLPAARPATNDSKRVGTNACEIDCMWEYVQSYSWSSSKKNLVNANLLVNYDDDATMATGIVEANHIDGVGE